jgi:flavin reductase (DIM6/NTAB) family NADH-FMN oxidoreductase RutF
MIDLLCVQQQYPRYLQNIKETGYFTINHINTKDIIADAHHTSANYGDTVSEFDKTNLEAEFKNGISTPL